ncbi:3-deoxy-manno-octulosonate cytidylyltransferase [Thraustotheca clavata]|uniref:3-deoxy-manno-octulosonate cytidylyltransferase n=1 Tax=Thraustotheca clavata TaxID=74557 RepID=A0A1V9ZR38_9STRA|nr:3-deoxy-manno-octulosonate cytidylyltransferase [Thraustotheca clavata]
MRAVGIIPARLRSTRFDAKPLALICGKPMIQHTFEAASKSTKLAGLFVATDAQEIAAIVQATGGHQAAILTESAIPTGTERVAQALKMLDTSYDIVVNIQGDEPGVNAKHIDLCIEALENDKDCVMSSLIAPVSDEKEARSHHVVKCVTNAQMHAMYFSRALIPASKDDTFDPTRTMKHIGLYAYRLSFLLDIFPTLPSPLGQIEDLEQLRVLEAGYKIKMVRVDHANPGVDLPEDIAKLEAILSLQQ